MLRTLLIAIAILTFSPSLFAAQCPHILNPKLSRAGNLTLTELEKAFTALEAHGAQIDMRLFKRANPTLDAVVSRAIGRAVTLDNVYFSLPAATNPRAMRVKLLGPLSEKEIVATSTDTEQDELVEAVQPTMTPLSEETQSLDTLAEQFEWTARILKTLARNGRGPNFVEVAQDHAGLEIIQVVKSAFGGSLFDATVEAGLDPENSFLLKETAYGLDEIIRMIKSNSVRHTAMLGDLAEGIAMEFTRGEIDMVEYILLTKFQREGIGAEKMAKLVTTKFNEQVSAQKVSELYGQLARNRTLHSYLRLTRP